MKIKVLDNPPKRRKSRKHRRSVAKRVVRKFLKSRRAKRIAKAIVRKAVKKYLNPARKRRAHKKRVRRHKNPFGSELAIIGNPMKAKRRHTVAKHKKRTHRRKRHSMSLLPNPFKGSNIMAAPKELFSAPFIVEAVAATTGFILPNIVMNYVPVSFRDSKVKYYVAKVGVVSLLSVAGNMHSKRTGRIVLLGGAISILLDVWTDFQASHAAPAPASGAHAYYGGMDAYYGGPAGGLGEIVDDEGNNEGF